MKIFLKVLKIVGGIIWVPAPAFLHLGIAASCETDDSGLRFDAVVLILVWWILSVGTYCICDMVGSAGYNYRTHYSGKPVKAPALAGKAVLFAFWILLLVFLHLAVIAAYESENGVLGWIIAAAVWWAATIAVYTVRSKRADKREAEAKAEYEAKYVFELLVEEELPGKARLCFDSHTGELESTEPDFPPFGAEPPKYLTVCGYNENDRERIFRAVREVCAHKEEIPELVYPNMLKTLGEYEQTDENGEPYTPEKLRAVMAVCSIDVCNSESLFRAELECCVVKGEADFGGHVYIASVNFYDKTIDCGIG